MRYTLTYWNREDGPLVLEVGSSADFTRATWTTTKGDRVAQMLVDAATPVAALETFYTLKPGASPAQMVAPTITREAAGQVPVVPSDRYLLRKTAAFPAHVNEPLWFAGLDSAGAVLDHGELSDVGQHPDTAMVVGIRPSFPLSADAPIRGLWAPMNVHAPDALGPIPALVNVLADVNDDVNPLFTQDGARVYMEAARGWNERMPAPCHVELFTRIDREDPIKLDVGPDLVDEGFELSLADGTLLGPSPMGLYELPAPPIVHGGWQIAPTA
ncbi:hypothetical protein ACFVWN_00900 [Nocardiopsis flavescens]|uniref:hypothetical protein n=1 Tax=Nocardiopsis flavescens TaxID=758803 RepID=UPI0036472991